MAMGFQSFYPKKPLTNIEKISDIFLHWFTLKNL